MKNFIGDRERQLREREKRGGQKEESGGPAGIVPEYLFHAFSRVQPIHINT